MWIYVNYVQVVNRLTGMQTGIFMDENDQVLLFFKLSQHLCLGMVAWKKNMS